MTRVTKIEIRPSTIELQEGEYGLVEAYLEPANATYADIVWTTDNSNIATVNSGHIVAKKRGTTKVKAVSLCDVSVKGECTLTVIPPKHVQSISFPQDEYTIVLGRPDYIFPNFTPSDALNKDLTWCCYDENIISVTDGLVTPKAAGTTKLIAVSSDGSHTASCTVRVVMESVTIKQDGGFMEVLFEKSGKTWKCIEHDMLYGTSEIDTSFLIERCNYNYFKYPNLNPIPYDYKEYTDDELKLLYAIDPYGVAEYISRYAERVIEADPSDDEDNTLLRAQLKYKDERYKAIIGDEPKYYKRIATNQIEWVETSNTSNLNAVLSQSESIFGIRRIHDDISKYVKQDELLKFAMACAKAVVGMFDKGTIFLTAYDLMVNTCIIVSTTPKEDVLNKLLITYSQTGTETIISLPDKLNDNVRYNKNNIIGWAKAIATGIGGLNDVLESSIVEKDFCEEIIYYYSNTTNYNVKIITRDGQEHTMQSVYDALKELRK